MSEQKAVVVDAGVRITGLLRRHSMETPRAGVILGSGLGGLAATLENAVSVDTSEIQGFPRSTVEGHRGAIHLGTLQGTAVVMLEGRVHCYEGYSLAEVGLPARVLCSLGLETLVVTNAAGGIAAELEPGSLMLIQDHINLLGGSPLEGTNVPTWGPRFPDMSTVYAKSLQEAAQGAATQEGLRLHVGVYAAVRGPQYETPAEIRMLAGLGADAVGMSTVPEVIVAAHMGVSVLGISVIANRAAGLSPVPLSHDDVLEAGRRAEADLQALVSRVVAGRSGS